MPASADTAHEAFDPYARWLGIGPEEQPPSHYRLLGLPEFTADEEAINAAADRRMERLHELASGERVDETQQLLNEVARARRVLLSDEKRREYDRRLIQETADAPQDAPVDRPPGVETAAPRRAATASAAPPRPAAPGRSTIVQRKPTHTPIILFLLGGVTLLVLIVALIVVLSSISGEPTPETSAQERSILRPAARDADRPELIDSGGLFPNTAGQREMARTAKQLLDEQVQFTRP